MKTTTLFLTGGNGFIGRNIQEAFSDRYTIIAPTHRELDLLDIEKVGEFLKAHPSDVLIHAANVGGTRKSDPTLNYLNPNLRMFVNLLRCRKYFKKIIFFGSGAEYNKEFPLIDIKEENFGRSIPKDDYGLYKFLCSKLLENDKDAVILRIFGLYGKYEDYDIRFISQSICKSIVGVPITINQNVYFDYLYIDDFMKILEYFLTHTPKYRVYNIGVGQKVDLYTIAQKIIAISKSNKPIVIKNKNLGKEYTCNIERLKNEIKELYFTPLDEALKKLYSYYEQNKSIIDMSSLEKF
ncbi:MAG: NAD(P)-dependent oxidoreductase [Patescibacteria group bacterium]